MSQAVREEVCPGSHPHWGFVLELVAELMVPMSQEEGRACVGEAGGGKSLQSLQKHFHLYSPVICALGHTDSCPLDTPFSAYPRGAQ